MKGANSVEIDDLDRRIINQLLDNGRKSFRKIAEAVDSTPATVINRVERLEEKDVINGYGAKVNYRQLGFEGIAAIEVVVKGESPIELEKQIAQHNHVVSLYSITGDTDILLLVKFEDREQLTQFVKEELLGTDQVEKTITHMAFDIFKEGDDPEL